MNGLDEIFYSPKNIKNLSLKLEKALKLKHSEQSMKYCQAFIKKNMENVFQQYGHKRPKKVPVLDFINKLNDKSIENAVDMFERKSHESESGHKQKVKRSPEPGRQEGRPQGRSRQPPNNDNIGGMLDGASGSSFAPVIDGPGGFMTADGRMGSRMHMGNTQNFSGGRNKGELEQRMLEKMNEMNQYGLMGNSGFGMGMGGMGMDGMPGMGGGMGGMGGMPGMGGGMPGMGGGMGGRRPQEINFSLDGGDSRNGIEREQFINVMGNDFGMGGGMGGGGNMAGMDPMMSGFGMFGSPNPMMGGGMQQQNPMMMQQQNPMMQQQNPMMQQQNPMMGGGMQQNPMMGGGMQQQNPMMQQMQQQNPMMMQHQNPQNMMQQQQQNNMQFDGGKMSQGDINSRMQQQISDRSNVNIPKGNFNPMQSPFQMTGNNLNFNTGGRVGNPVNNNYNASSNLQQANDILDLDNEKLKKMSSKEISKMIEQKKRAFEINESDINNSNNNNESNNEDERKKKFLENIKNMINKQKNQQKELHKSLRKDAKDNRKSSKRSDSDGIEMRVKKKKHRSKSSDSESESLLLSDNSDYESIKEVDNSKKYKVKDKENSSEKSEEKKKEVIKEKPKDKNIIEIDVEQISEPEHYNNYMYEFDEPYLNVNSIELLDYEFPKSSVKIDKENREFLLIVKGKTTKKYPIEIEDGDYSFNEIIEMLEKCFEMYNINITIECDSKKRIILKGKYEFEIKNLGLLSLFGFKDKHYEGSNEYTSEREHAWGDNKFYLYLYLGGKDKREELLGMIDGNKVKKIKKEFTDPIKKMKALVFKFKKSETEDEDFVDFNDEPHKMKIKIGSD
jgi:hypothetical protein